MFGLLNQCIASLLSVGFPTLATYKALRANDLSLLRPWIMYWVVLGLGTSAESFLKPFLNWIPFYSTIRIGVLFWLVSPTTQGAVQVYSAHVDPWIEAHETDIDSVIASVYTRLKQFVIDRFPQLGGAADNADATPRAASAPAAAPPASVSGALFSRFRQAVPQEYTLGALMSSWSIPASNEQINEQRTRLLEMLTSLDKARNETDKDGYDVVDVPTPTGAQTKKRWW